MEGGFLPEGPAGCISSGGPIQPITEARRQQSSRGGDAHGGTTSAAAVEPPPPGTHCSRCPAAHYNAEWHRAFGVVLCNVCRKQEALISKSTARERYSLSDADLQPLGSLRKDNPHKRDWQAMHLYLESQVAGLAHGKHGGAEGLAAYQQGRMDARLATKLKRREEDRKREQQEGSRLERIRQRITGEGQRGAAAEVASAAVNASDEEEI